METQTTVEQAFDAAPAPTVEAPITTVTEENLTPEQRAAQEAEPVVDYKEKFSASSREALRLKTEGEAEKARADAAEARLAELEGAGPGGSSEALFPGFEELSEDQQRDLQNFTGTIRKQAVDEIMKDPAIAHARDQYNRTKFNEAFDKVATELPELRESQAEFKAKYFRPTNVPDNIESILRDVAKSHLFDKARDIGALEGREQAERLDLERARGGEGPRVTTHRTLEDWQRMQQENPAQFASLSKEYNEDVSAGRLGE